MNTRKTPKPPKAPLTLAPDALATPPKPVKVPKGKAPPKTAPKAKDSTATTTPPPKALAGVTIRAEVLTYKG